CRFAGQASLDGPPRGEAESRSRRAAWSVLAQARQNGSLLNGVRAGLTRADTNDLIEGADEDLAVTNLAGVCGLADGIHHLLHHGIVERQLNLHLGQKVHHVFGAAIQLRVTLLSAKAFYFRDCHTLHANFRKSGAYI